MRYIITLVALATIPPLPLCLHCKFNYRHDDKYDVLPIISNTSDFRLRA